MTAPRPQHSFPREGLYEGLVSHHRASPVQHSLSHRVFALLVDVARLDRPSPFRLLSTRRTWWPMALLARDHLDGSGTSLLTQSRALFARFGLADCGAHVMLKAYPRLFGYGFNPISLFYGFRADGRLGAMIYQVTNTFRERHCYVLPVHEGADGPAPHGTAKDLYVSPFQATGGDYRFRLNRPGDRLSLSIAADDGAGGHLTAHFEGRHAPLGDAALMGAMARHPLMTFAIMADIHRHAFRLWRKGLRVHRHSPAPRFTVGPTGIDAPSPAPTPPHKPSPARPDGAAHGFTPETGRTLP
ncbi:DUF1365 domain-containing protein [Yunchengibacter salinarum]|uniref:DUF1365 domain-containing protein n=1 Tax=Yunchengibacter salinarum TaxID=3133399 RepID=UPI0035B68DBF